MGQTPKTMRVAFVGQPNYEPEAVRASIERVIELSGFDLQNVSGKRVLLKPNMLGAYPVSEGVTTHPEFVCQVAKIFKDAGADVSVGDSPNGVYPLDQTWRVTGIRDACARAGVKEASFEASGSVLKNGVMISRAVVDADIVVNLPKFKTHGLTILTLAVKNLFGCVNGMAKTTHHRDNQSPEKFVRMLVNISEAVKPALTIIDGIVAMEGNGPSGGKLRELGVVVVGTDIYSVDAACSKFVGLDPLKLGTLSAAKEIGAWDDKATIEIVGDNITPVQFELPVTYTERYHESWLMRFIMDRIWSNLTAQPKIDPDICNACLICVRACPVAAIDQKVVGRPPKINKDKCMQCFCCHEVCPNRAIEIKRSLAIRIALWFWGSGNNMFAKSGSGPFTSPNFYLKK